MLLKLLQCASLPVEILTLTWERAVWIWFKVFGNVLALGIEWGSLSTEVIDKHYNLFTLEEVNGLSGDNQRRKEAVNSALKRAPQGVLHAFYQSLRATQTCSGATQHASIAELIEKESEFACSHTMGFKLVS